MLEKVDLSKKLEKEEYKKRKEELETSLSGLQRKLREKKVPVMIVFEGLGSAGKGEVINKLILPLDPRGFEVFTTGKETQEEEMHPFLWRFWTKTPERGRIAIYDRSWYRKVLLDRYDGLTPQKEMEASYEEINSFEKMLADDGMLIIKFFLYISKKEQKKRIRELLGNRETKWRVSKGDLDRNRHYEEFLRLHDMMLQKTDTSYAPWTIVEAEQKKYAVIKVMSIVEKCFQDKLTEIENAPALVKDGKFSEGTYVTSTLKNVDLSKALSRREYEEKLELLQKKLSRLHNELYTKRIPVILAFEGWDAGGKGGAIKRLTGALDPRGYTVNPTAAPNDIEKVHHYLWRFWTKVPKDGHVAVFDRTWYGRVMVERIEGFCASRDWERAYKEMNDMEKQFSNHGAVVLKFWMQIDKEEQERRFTERQNTPDKTWKITDEDWRNREKWDLYEQAVDEMLIRTSTTYAPWVIVEGNNKYYARIKVLETVIDAIEKRLGKKSV
ncbi:MAG TPA: polyphosphate:AMP phosphotransferase [Lachnospiraceae bacterium]|nr:polyphosphate:AMP phosphotransferase [Lachnospiraceae bacterium]